MGWLERLVGQRETMGMEIKNLLTNGRINFYFGEIDNFEGDKHFNAYTESVKYVFSLTKVFFDEKLFLRTSNKLNLLHGKEEIKLFKKSYLYTIFKDDLLDNSFLEILYNSNNNEALIFSSNVKAIISFDPVIVDVVIETS